MKKQHAMKPQPQGRTCILRVDNIHCDGCKGKVRKLLMKIDGVNATSIDVEQGKVAVTGNVDPAVLIRKLEKSGKHAEIWRNNSNNNKNKSIQFDNLNNQFKSLQMGSVKGGVGGGGGDKKAQYMGGKDGRHIQYQPLAKDMKVKDQKTVRFDLSKKAHDFDDFSEDEGFDDEDEYSDDDDDDEYFDDDYDDEEFGFGGHQHQHSQKKLMPKNGKPVGKEKKKKAKKAGGGFMAILGKAIGGKGKGKHGNGGKKGGSGSKKNKGGEIQIHGGGKGKIVTKVGGGDKGIITNMKKGGGGGKNGMYSDFEVTNHRNGGRGGGGGGMGQYRNVAAQGAPAPQMMNMHGGGAGRGGGGNGCYPAAGMGPMTLAGGAGVGPMMPAGNPYQQQQQQQYMAMMMNQQRMMNGGGDMMYHPAMYERPPPGYGYVPPMLPPSPAPAYHHEPYTHMFSDESTESCSIM